jgi:hypothetical protein
VKIFFNLSKVLEIIRRHKSHQNAKRFQTSGFFPESLKYLFGHHWKISTFIIFKGSLKILKLPEFFFRSSLFCKSPLFFLIAEMTFFYSTYVICPK